MMTLDMSKIVIAACRNNEQESLGKNIASGGKRNFGWVKLLGTRPRNPPPERA